MNLKPRTVQLGTLPDGGLGLVYEDGRPVPPQTPMPMNAAKLTELLTGWVGLAVQAGHRAGVDEGVRAVAGPQYAAGVEAGARATAGPVYEAAAKAGAVAGVKAGAEYAYANSVVRRRIERDPSGQITGTVEERVSMPDPANPDKELSESP